jgi:hypothetical protein
MSGSFSTVSENGLKAGASDAGLNIGNQTNKPTSHWTGFNEIRTLPRLAEIEGSGHTTKIVEAFVA